MNAVVTDAPLRIRMQRAAAERLRRKKARASIVEFARCVEIPGRPAAEYELDPGVDRDMAEDAYLRESPIFRAVETEIAKHHAVIMNAAQDCIETYGGRLMIIAPPGSAKSTYIDIIVPAWAMGAIEGFRVILASYATKLARKQSRRAQQIVRTRKYISLWDSKPSMRRDMGSAEEWGLTNGSEYMAAGILAGITGNRAHLAIGDDLIAGRQEAESPTIRESTMEAYRDDLESRLLPGGSLILINTRWHMDDPSGQILPLDYDGRSGLIECRDGRTWNVVNIPAKAERSDDPVGRKIGEYLWPEYQGERHYKPFEQDPRGQRRWASLYQGRPTAASGEDFDASWFKWYDSEFERPKRLTLYGASDYAVKEIDPKKQKLNEADFSEHGLIGLDDEGDVWFLDWWSGQVETDKAIKAWIAMLQRWKGKGVDGTNVRKWWHEGGTIDKAVSPYQRRAMRKARTFVTREALTAIADKRAKCQSFQGLASSGVVHFPSYLPWSQQVIEQLTGFPGHRWDDKYDVCGLLGRGIDQMIEAPEEPRKNRKTIKPFTDEWLEANDQPDRPAKRYR